MSFSVNISLSLTYQFTVECFLGNYWQGEGLLKVTFSYRFVFLREKQQQTHKQTKNTTAEWSRDYILIALPNNRFFFFFFKDLFFRGFLQREFYCIVYMGTASKMQFTEDP